MLSLSNFESFKKFLIGSEADPEKLYKTDKPQLGLYQFTTDRIKDIANYLNVSVPSNSTFLNSPSMQDYFFNAHIYLILKDIENNNLQSFIGQSVEGAHNYPYVTNIELWGIVAGAHLGGSQGVKNFLIDGTDPHDSNNTYISDYIAKFSDYYKKNLNPVLASVSFPGILGIFLLIGLIFAVK